MGKVVLTWEGGAYLGHQMLVTSAAQLLQRAGHEAVVYAPQGTEPNSAALRDGVRWAWAPPAPDTASVQPAGVAWRSRATSVWNAGFHDEEIVRERLHAWDVVLQREQPHLVLLQAAPFAQAMARLAGYRSVEFGIGFDVPPNTSPFPPFRQGDEFSAVQALQLEQAMLQRIARVFRGAPVGERLYAMLSGDTRLVTSIAELDHYDGCGDVSRRFVGPLPVAEASQTRPQWRERKPRVLGYLRASLFDAPALLRTLAKLRAEAVVVCIGADEATATLAEKLGVRLYASPISFADLLPAADIVVSHGGGLMAEALVRGCACVALPTHYEQFMTASTLHKRRVGLNVNPREARLYEPALRHALTDPNIRREARAIGQRYRRLRDEPGADFLLEVEAAMAQARLEER